MCTCAAFRDRASERVCGRDEARRCATRTGAGSSPRLTMPHFNSHTQVLQRQPGGAAAAGRLGYAAIEARLRRGRLRQHAGCRCALHAADWDPRAAGSPCRRCVLLRVHDPQLTSTPHAPTPAQHSRSTAPPSSGAAWCSAASSAGPVTPTFSSFGPRTAPCCCASTCWTPR